MQKARRKNAYIAQFCEYSSNDAFCKIEEHTDFIIYFKVPYIEADARRSAKIEDDWYTVKSIDDNIGALLFYDKEEGDYKYFIYEKKDIFLFGYGFSKGGYSKGIKDGVQAYDYGKSIAIMSMNNVNASTVEVIFRNSLEENRIYNVDEDKPFSIVVPLENKDVSVQVYDNEGLEIPVLVSKE